MKHRIILYVYVINQNIALSRMQENNISSCVNLKQHYIICKFFLVFLGECMQQAACQRNEQNYKHMQLLIYHKPPKAFETEKNDYYDKIGTSAQPAWWLNYVLSA